MRTKLNFDSTFHKPSDLKDARRLLANTADRFGLMEQSMNHMQHAIDTGMPLSWGIAFCSLWNDDTSKMTRAHISTRGTFTLKVIA